MTTPDQQAKPQANPQANPQDAQPGTDELNRSENLLPGEEGAEDGRFEVAEEVSLDIQGDDTRRVGQMPGSITESLPDTVSTEPDSEDQGKP